MSERILGRGAELQKVGALLADETPTARALVLTDEPGVGKTTIWMEGVRLAGERGLCVLAARPAEAEPRCRRRSSAARHWPPGNDSTRPYAVATDRRVAEFKLSRWDGHDAGRKRHLFKDLVHLAAADHACRTVELYVLGSRPAQFLRTTRSVAAGLSTEGRNEPASFSSSASAACRRRFSSS